MGVSAGALRARPECSVAVPGLGEAWYSLAVVEDDGAVGPAVVVDQAEVGEDAHPYGCQPPLVTDRETIAVYLEAYEE